MFCYKKIVIGGLAHKLTVENYMNKNMPKSQEG